MWQPSAARQPREVQVNNEVSINDYMKGKPDIGVIMTSFGPLAYDTLRFTVVVQDGYRRIRCESCGKSVPFGLNQVFESNPFLQHDCAGKEGAD